MAAHLHGPSAPESRAACAIALALVPVWVALLVVEFTVIVGPRGAS